jgi:hypothetical protein
MEDFDREEIDPGDVAPLDEGLVGENLCFDCGGGGQIEGEICATCAGTGVAIDEGD